MRTLRCNDITIRVVGGTDGDGGGDGPLVVLLHGFGAPGDDLVPLHSMLRDERKTRFAFPEAPLSLASIGGPMMGDGRAWWMIDMARLEQAMASGAIRDMSDEEPQGMEAVRTQLAIGLQALSLELGADSFVLGGFSQGAMTACDLVLRSDLRIDKLVILSGTLLCRSVWAPLIASHTKLPIFQSHGRMDPLLAFSLAENLRDLWQDAGHDVDWHPFDGAHEIPLPVLQGLERFLQQ